MSNMRALPRNAWRITYGVWKALFLREAVTRVSANRTAWAGLLLEPVFHIAFLVMVFTFIRVRVIGGIDTPVWLMVGMLAFFMFRRTAQQGKNAISANRSLFAYRQVKPVDTVLVRAGLEGFLMTLIALIVFGIAALFGFSLLPADPLAVLEAFFGLWLLGLGFGLLTSATIELLPETDRFIELFMMPLYLISGVIFPIASIPQPYRDWLLLNPLVHGLEAARLGFAPYYHAVPELSIAYLYGFALVMLFFGLALHRRFAKRLVAQ